MLAVNKQTQDACFQYLPPCLRWACVYCSVCFMGLDLKPTLMRILQLVPSAYSLDFLIFIPCFSVSSSIAGHFSLRAAPVHPPHLLWSQWEMHPQRILVKLTHPGSNRKSPASLRIKTSGCRCAVLSSNHKPGTHRFVPDYTNQRIQPCWGQEKMCEETGEWIGKKKSQACKQNFAQPGRTVGLNWSIPWKKKGGKAAQLVGGRVGITKQN